MSAVLETRVDRLEFVLEQFITQTNAMMARMERDTKQLRQELRQERETSQREMADFKEEMRQAREKSERGMASFKEEMRQAREKSEREIADFKEEMRQARENSERGMTTFKEEMRQAREKSEREMADFKEEMRQARENSERGMTTFKEEMQQSREAFHREMRTELTEFKQQMNKRWGDLANSLGRIVEDIVAPSIPHIINKYFAAQNVYLLSERVVKRRTSPPPRTQEFDVIAVFDDKILINETKSQPRLEYIHKFLQTLTDWQQYFPEYADKKLIPIFSSLHLPAATVAYLTEQKIYALAMREDGMEILNLEEIN
jgi:DNA repair exonuclease SbcCD ATPase subunit